MDLFISYKSEERDWAYEIMRFLASNGVTCWLDKEEIKIGENYEKEIAKIMPNCLGIILLLSEQSQQSVEVKVEYEMAKRLGLEIYPIKIDKSELTDYYKSELSHVQRESDYVSMSEQEKHTVLETIRDKVYQIKGLPIKTAKDFQKDRIAYLQSELLEEYKALKSEWNEVIKTSVSRCGFLTPEPEYMMNVIGDRLQVYYKIVDDYISEVLYNWYEDETIYALVRFMEKYDLTKVLWQDYKSFIKTALEAPELNYLKYDDEYRDAFLCNMYKDYIMCMRSNVLQHPMVRLINRTKEMGGVRFELLLTFIRREHQTEFFAGDSPLVFVELDYVGENYLNFNGMVRVESNRTVFKPEEMKKPEWFDFVRMYYADELLENAELGIKEFKDFLKKNPTVSHEGKLNSLYFYITNKLIIREKLRLLRVYVATLMDDCKYVSEEMWNRSNKTILSIEKMRRLLMLSMLDNGYEQEEIRSVLECFR